MKQGRLPWLLIAAGMIVMTTGLEDGSLQAVTQSNNLFSTKLYDAIRNSSNDNLIVSPLSVSTVLAMLQAGARGETANSLRAALHFPADDQLNSGFQALLQQLQSDDSVTLELVNRLFPAEGHKLNPAFTSTLKSYYAAEPTQLDFTKNVEAAASINKFVTNATHDRIHDLIQADDLGQDTRLVLVNAIYFKGQWKNQFPKDATSKMPFFTTETDSVQVDMMRLETEMLYGEIPELDAQAVSLPYKGDRYSMLILLPNKRTGLVQMEEKLASYPLDRILQKMRERKVQLYLPKFKLESTIDLKDPLTKLGLGDLFEAKKADLSGILADSKENLYVSKAIQKAFIEVNEEGSEAAAATAVNVMARSGFLAPSVVAEHPFKSIIYSASNRVHLFTSAVVNPTVFETRFRSLISEEGSSGTSSASGVTFTSISIFLALITLVLPRI